MSDEELLALAEAVIRNTTLYPNMYRESAPTLALAHGVVRLLAPQPERPVVWCQTEHLAHLGAHFQTPDCLFPRHATPAMTTKFNRENPQA